MIRPHVTDALDLVRELRTHGFHIVRLARRGLERVEILMRCRERDEWAAVVVDAAMTRVVRD